MEMKSKKLLVSFLAVFGLLLLVANVSSADGYNITKVRVNGVEISNGTQDFPSAIGIIAGETIKVEVYFESTFGDRNLSNDSFAYDSDVTVEVELDTGKNKVRALSDSMIVESGEKNRVALMLKVPYELKDELSEVVDLTIEISGDKYEFTSNPYYLRVKRPQYKADIKSVSIPNSIEAGETFPVDIVLKNIGYKNLDDVYVTVSVPDLGIRQSGYFGDLVALEANSNNDNDEDSANGRLYLKVPYDVASGVYALEVEVANDDTTSGVVKQVAIKNDFEDTVFVSGDKLLIVNPTNKIIVYNIIPDSPASVSESMVSIPAGSSRTITVNPNTEGAYNFNVNIFSMTGELVKTVSFAGEGNENVGNKSTKPIVVLTVVLAIIFLVLLVILIVLIGKKPEKTEEFGESYY